MKPFFPFDLQGMRDEDVLASSRDKDASSRKREDGFLALAKK